MKILVTGAKGFVGKNLCCALYNLKDGKDRTRPNLHIDEVYEYDLDTPEEKLDEYCEKADFVFHLAGVNRPKDNAEFMQGNFGFSSVLLDTAEKAQQYLSRNAFQLGAGDADRSIRTERLRQIQTRGGETFLLV